VPSLTLAQVADTWLTQIERETQEADVIRAAADRLDGGA
jgi:hypothetical protein